MTTDDDAPRTIPEDEPGTDALELTRPRGATATQAPLIDESETDEDLDLAGADAGPPPAPESRPRWVPRRWGPP